MGVMLSDRLYIRQHNTLFQTNREDHNKKYLKKSRPVLRRGLRKLARGLTYIPDEKLKYRQIALRLLTYIKINFIINLA
jgi:hypothetical protein